MSEVAILILLFAVGVLMLVAEVFVPSHGVLTVAGLGFVIAGVVRTFDYAGREAGIVAIIACLILLPTFSYVAIKYWHRTPIGRRIAPPNPIALATDSSVPIEQLSRLVGQVGEAKTQLRPVGICEFGGKRISCIAEYGLIEAGVPVEAVRIKGSNLAVQAKKA